MNRLMYLALLILASAVRVEIVGLEIESLFELYSKIIAASIGQAHFLNKICLWGSFALEGGLTINNIIHDIGFQVTYTRSILITMVQALQSIRILYVATALEVFYLTWITTLALLLGTTAVVSLSLCYSDSPPRVWFREDRSLAGLVEVLRTFPLMPMLLQGLLLQNFLDYRLGRNMLKGQMRRANTVKEYRWQELLMREAAITRG